MHQYKIAEGITRMVQAGYKVMTVSDLVSHLAGLPPMMEVFLDLEGEAMFVNKVEVQTARGYAPFVRLIGGTRPAPVHNVDQDYEESVARQKQRAMQMTRNSELATKMPEVVE